MAAKPVAQSAAVIARLRISCRSGLGFSLNLWHRGGLGHASLCYELNSLIGGTINPRLPSRAMRFGSTTNRSDEDVPTTHYKDFAEPKPACHDLFRLPQGVSHDSHRH
jgi:hypothetical protein